MGSVSPRWARSVIVMSKFSREYAGTDRSQARRSISKDGASKVKRFSLRVEEEEEEEGGKLEFVVSAGYTQGISLLAHRVQFGWVEQHFALDCTQASQALRRRTVLLGP